MKHEIGVEKPDYLIEDWPGKYDVFSWLEYVVTVPNPIFLITTLKGNGLPNANLHSWGLLIGEKEKYMSLIALLKHTHTYTNITREKEWCINFPGFSHYPEGFETIHNNEYDVDEITKAGFTVEESKKVRAPRISECMINLECKLKWQHNLSENGSWHLFCGEIVHVAVDENVIIPDPVERMKKMQLMYNIRGTINPLNGVQYGPNTLGLIKEVVKITSDDGLIKLWRDKLANLDVEVNN